MNRATWMLIAALSSTTGCREAPAAQLVQAQARNEHGAPPEAVKEAHAADEPLGHAPGEAREKRSDLDQSVEALFAQSCEHGRKTFECDECRYGVGVARVPRSMLDDGVVKTAAAARRKLEAPLPLTGEIRFDERRVTHLAPSTEARVRTVRVSLGQRVRAGEALLDLESVALGEAQSHYLESRAAVELARRAAERAESLRQEKINSEKEWLQARAERDGAEIRLRGAHDKLVRLGLTPAEVTALARGGGSAARGGLVLRAPAAGVVLEMHAVPGELVRPDQSILTVGDLSELWLWADLYEDQLSRVVSGSATPIRAGISVKAFPGEEFPGTVDFVGPTMDEKTRTVKVRIAVKNRDGKLRAGMFAAVQLFLPGTQEALAVPRSAVLTDEGRSFVFVHHHGEFFVRRPVEPGRSTIDWVEVKKGLVGGETVVATGSFLLKSDVLRSKMGAGCAD